MTAASRRSVVLGELRPTCQRPFAVGFRADRATTHSQQTCDDGCATRAAATCASSSLGAIAEAAP
jgi:hypothetical protein